MKHRSRRFVLDQAPRIIGILLRALMSVSCASIQRHESNQAGPQNPQASNRPLPGSDDHAFMTSLEKSVPQQRILAITRQDNVVLIVAHHDAAASDIQSHNDLVQALDQA